MVADVLDGTDVRVVGRSLSAMADALLDAALAAADAPADMAVVGLGRLGGEELSYSSDLDVVFLAEPDGADEAAVATAAARGVVARIHDPRRGGRLWEVDARLRPEGPNAPIVTTLAGATAYYAGRAGQWELQSMLRIRHVAGDAALTARFADAVAPMVHPAAFGDDAAAAIRSMKRRIEAERCPQDERKGRHLKLGPGGLSDVEFTVQLLQLAHGAAHPAIRTPSTFEAIDRLAAEGLVDADDAQVLREAYELASRLRDRLYLERGQARDELPADPADLDVIARSLGAGTGAELAAQWATTAARCRAVVERVFYGAPAGQSGG
jgi:glutamate-ammonia-ligase adenylyltransferase